MAPDGAELLIAGVAVVALLLAPVASALIRRRGDAIAAEINGDDEREAERHHHRDCN
ncbi:MAG: hypothetical protein M3383_06530 [Actinomycetota bacterium]|nr:hypothetical protein [Actinomycetota bacterium]